MADQIAVCVSSEHFLREFPRVESYPVHHIRHWDDSSSYLHCSKVQRGVSGFEGIVVRTRGGYRPSIMGPHWLPLTVYSFETADVFTGMWVSACTMYVVHTVYLQYIRFLSKKINSICCTPYMGFHCSKSLHAPLAMDMLIRRRTRKIQLYSRWILSPWLCGKRPKIHDVRHCSDGFASQ